MISSSIKSVLPTFGRIILTLLAFSVGWGLLSLMAVFHAFINQERSDADTILLKSALPITSTAVAPKRSLLWPQYPVHGSVAAHELILNGTPVTIEEWESSTAPRNILNYYETQMMARGWRDSMKEIRSLVDAAAVQLQQGGGSVAAMSASQYLQGVQPNGNLSLELERPGWSMSIDVEPSGKSINQSRVTITAAPVASLKEIASSIAAASKPAAFGNDNKPLDMVRNMNGARYHTTIASTKKDANQALMEALADLNAKDWHLSMPPFRQGHSDYFAWLVKGKQYATLSVKASPQGKSSSVTFTEVTPD